MHIVDAIARKITQNIRREGIKIKHNYLTQKKAINRCMREQAEKVFITCADFLCALKEPGFAPPSAGGSIKYP